MSVGMKYDPELDWPLIDRNDPHVREMIEDGKRLTLAMLPKVLDFPIPGHRQTPQETEEAGKKASDSP